MKDLAASTNPLAMLDESAGLPVTLSCVGTCHGCIAANGTPAEKHELNIFQKEVGKHGLRFSSLIRFDCSAHLSSGRQVALKAAKTRNTKQHKLQEKLAYARHARATKLVVERLAVEKAEQVAAAQAKAAAEKAAAAKPVAVMHSSGSSSDDDDDDFDDDDEEEGGSDEELDGYADDDGDDAGDGQDADGGDDYYS